MNSQICKIAKCASSALNESVCAVVSAAALKQYEHIVELIKKCVCIDINKLFGLIATLVVICWISQWLLEIFKFIVKTIPAFIKNLCVGKVSFCLLDCPDLNIPTIFGSKSHKSSTHKLSSNKSYKSHELYKSTSTEY